MKFSPKTSFVNIVTRRRNLAQITSLLREFFLHTLQYLPVRVLM